MKFVRLLICSSIIFGFGAAGSLRAQTLVETMAASAINAETAQAQAAEASAQADARAAEVANAVAEMEAGGQPAVAGNGGADDAAPVDGDSKPVNMLVTGDDTEDENMPVPANVFTNPEVIRQWLGANPRFIYHDNEKPDPMMIPWLAADYEAGNLLKQAEAMWKDRGDDAEKWIAALRIMEKIMVEFPQSEAATKNGKLFTEWKEAYRKKFPPSTNQAVAVVQEELRFPPWIRKNFSSILFNNENLGQSRVLIDSEIYQVGNYIKGTEDVTGAPGPASVKILAIERLENDLRFGYVVFEFNQKQYYYGPKGIAVPGHENPQEK